MQAQIWDLKIPTNVGRGVLAERGEVDAGGVVDDNFGAAADFSHRFLEGAGEVVVGGHVRGIGADGG